MEENKQESKFKERFTNFLEKTRTIYSKCGDAFFKFLHKYGWIIVCVIGVILSTIAKYYAFFNKSADYNEFLEPWMNYYKEVGVVKGLSETVGNYTPFYNYFLAIAAQIVPQEGYVYIIKWFDVPFEIAFSVAVFLIVFHKSRNYNYSSIAFLCSLILPSIFINGAIWGQFDIIFSVFIIWSFYFVLLKKYNMCMVFYAISFAIKIQAVFFIPFLLILILKREIKVWQIIYIPLIYILFALPALFCGRPFSEIMMIYITQSTEDTPIVNNAPSLYGFFDVDASPLLGSLSVPVFLLIMGVLVFYFYQKDIELSIDNLILIALISSLFAPYFMPHVHERYFFVADLFAMIYVFIRKRGFFTCLLINFASIICCSANVLRGYGEPSMFPHFLYYRVGSCLNTIAIVLLIIEMIKIPTKPKPPVTVEE